MKPIPSIETCKRKVWEFKLILCFYIEKMKRTQINLDFPVGLNFKQEENFNNKSWDELCFFGWVSFFDVLLET